MRPSNLNRPQLAKTNRRRSLSALFRIPLSTRTPEYPVISASQAVGSVPADIIREVVELLSPADILSFSLTSSAVRAFLIPALYESVYLRSSRKCRVTLAMLAKRPDICVHIRKLTVRPNYYLSWPKPDEPLEESWVEYMIGQIAGNLTSLHTFDWDGLELPSDRMWGTLRRCCPHLRNIFSNVGSRPLDANSELFSFSDLKSFSLIVRYGLDGTELFPPCEPLPATLWDMLRHRCPDLEELAICSFSPSSRLLDFLPATEARWPKLQSLTLGSFGYQNDFTLGPADDESFAEFLNDHPTLKYMRLQWNFKRWMSPAEMRMELSPNALPELDTFVGVYQQLARLPNPRSIETLDLTCEPLHESRLEVICPILRTLTSLTSLDLWTHIVHPNQDNTHLFSSILSACRGLTDLHFMCTMTFTAKSLKQFISQLYWLPKLEKFSLTKGHKYGDETMLESALQILRAKPTLQQINIRWAREKAPNHLKQEGTYDITAIEGEPVYIMVHEQGIPLVGRAFERRYKYTIGPPSGERSLTPSKLVGDSWPFFFITAVTAALQPSPSNLLYLHAHASCRLSSTHSVCMARAFEIILYVGPHRC
ncbi:hypothetical protein LshimejAT787_0900450 [Lyophyllum shimeji]|uniref:F-box domain-containing protein n=1 Tax=Lyophyllum shimeji TaxID=47721 RepID=A0A9P3PQJ4_LYOSH|nr:hypothetical protein LshimejAT787_0900450 [Lyophyllum shimeji]